ncbi:Trichome birefringence-like, N-terminal domain [Dillenia turbinata]|uniref:Trichome birefringence-like, N-terminal domain n=1 Tax=Dillenia turbinata TaxID=194707 RepID=A0AAN8VK08_9MAGN
MDAMSSFKAQHFTLIKLFAWTLYALFAGTFLCLYLYPLAFYQPFVNQLSPNNPNSEPLILLPSHLRSSPSSSPPPAAQKEETTQTPEEDQEDKIHQCEYSEGEWVKDNSVPLYNDTSCGTIKYGRNCISHGRPDSGYLYWKWEPNQCELPKFAPHTFLQLFSNKHLAFVGDSLARNQLESLLCLLSTNSSPKLVYNYGEDDRFRRWHFDSHNFTLSSYWSPLLVKGIEKYHFNTLYVDYVDEKWASDLDLMDMVVLVAGQWLLLSAVYYEGGLALGCHLCPGLNHTEVGFYDAYGKVLRTSLKSIIERRGNNSDGKPITVLVVTFPPAHFEGEWDKFGVCPKTKPYKDGEKSMGSVDEQMRKIGIEEVEFAKEKAKQFGNVRLEILDVTKLAFMRPDGHPGPYMFPFPFAKGPRDRVPNDCIHWCMPGPIDTWNEILLEMIKRSWKAATHR